MIFRKPSSRWSLWVFAAALLLKSAMPWLASASAQMQGKTLIEVCTVYGVSMVPLAGPAGDASDEPGPTHGAVHGGEHCALSALTALAAPALRPFDLTSAPVGADPAPRARPSARASDACATWVARLHHGPPSFA